MRPYYFDYPDNFARLQAELERWRGTPFMEGQGQAGKGADCVRFVEGVLVNLGAIDPVAFPPYVTRGGGEEMLRIFLETMDKIPKLECVWHYARLDVPGGAPEPRPAFRRGDVLLVSSGKALHHLAIIAEPPVVWHCYREVGEANVHDPVVEHHIKAIYRATIPTI